MKSMDILCSCEWEEFQISVLTLLANNVTQCTCIYTEFLRKDMYIHVHVHVCKHMRHYIIYCKP